MDHEPTKCNFDEQKCNEHKETIKSIIGMDQKLNEIHLALIGDYHTQGLVTELKANTKEVQKLSAWHDDYAPELETIIKDKRIVKTGMLINLWKCVPWAIITLYSLYTLKGVI